MVSKGVLPVLALVGINIAVISGTPDHHPHHSPDHHPHHSSDHHPHHSSDQHPQHSTRHTRGSAPNLLQLLVNDPEFSTLVAAVQAAGLQDIFTQRGPFTVFAPNNAAFAKIPADTLNGLLADKDALTKVLARHVIKNQKITSADIKSPRNPPTFQVPTFLDEFITIKKSGGAVLVNNARVIKVDALASNGVAHVIDAVLAEEKAPAYPPAPAPPPPAYPAPRQDNLLQTLVGNPDFSTLVTAVTTAGLQDIFAEPGPFTVFAPNNAAFAKVPKKALVALLADKNALTKVLARHVIKDAKVTSSDIINDSRQSFQVETFLGEKITVKKEYGNVLVNEATVIQPDVLASNGVAHVIDTVLLAEPQQPQYGSPQPSYGRPAPPQPHYGSPQPVYHRPQPPQPHYVQEPAQPNLLETLVGNPDFSTLVTAVKAAGLTDLFAQPGPFTVFAPNNAAFAKVPGDALNALLADKNALTKVLARHVIKGAKFTSTDIVNDERSSFQLDTFLSEKITIKKQYGKVLVNEATVIQPDVFASNGVAHVIDTVLLAEARPSYSRPRPSYHPQRPNRPRYHG